MARPSVMRSAGSSVGPTTLGPARPGTGGVAHIVVGIILGAAIGVSAGAAGSQLARQVALVVPLTGLGMWLTHRSGPLHWRSLTLPAFLYVVYLLQVVVSGLWIAQTEDGPAATRLVIAVISGLLTLPLGFMLASLVLGSTAGEIDAFYVRPMEHRSIALPIYLCAAIAASLLLARYVTEVPVNPLAEMIALRGNVAELAQLREESLTGLESPFRYAYAVVRDVGFPFLICLALAHWLMTRRAAWLAMLAFVLAAGLAMAAVSTAKGPVAEIFFVAFFVVYLMRRGSVGARSLLLWSVIVLAFPLTVYIMTMDLGVTDAAQLLLGHRLWFAPARVALEYFQSFPDDVGFLYGRGIGALSWLLGTEYFNTGYYILQRIYPGGPPSGSAGGMFLASLYADFGFSGVVLGGLATGFIVQALQISLVRSGKTPLTIGVMAFLFYPVWMLTSRALPTVVLSTGLLLVPGVAWCMRLADLTLRARGIGSDASARALRRV